jgi:hypothetical protein
MHDVRPTWLTEPCPHWCVAEHRQDDHPDDRVHRGESTTLAGFLAHGAVPTEFEEEPAHLVIQVMRPVGGSTTWVEVRETEGARHRLTVTLATARDLGRLLTRIAPR